MTNTQTIYGRPSIAPTAAELDAVLRILVATAEAALAAARVIA